MAARVGDAGGTSSARRRRERRQRSWWRHEQLSVAAALATARHHSAGPVLVMRREEQQEEVEQDTYEGPRAQSTPPPRARPGVLKDPGPPWVEAVTVGYVAAGAPSLSVVLVSDDRIDDATLQFLLHQSLLAHAEEEEKAREEAEVMELEEVVAQWMQRLEEEVAERHWPRHAVRVPAVLHDPGGASSSTGSVNTPVVPETLRVRIVILVVLVLRHSGGSCSTCCVESYFTVFNGHFFQATAWHTACVWCDHDGSALFGSIGTCVHIRSFPHCLCGRPAVAMVSPMSGSICRT